MLSWILSPLPKHFVDLSQRGSCLRAKGGALLEKERHALRLAVIANGPSPGVIHGAEPSTAFAPHNGPVIAGQIEGTEVLQQGLETDEPNVCRTWAEIGESMQAFAIFHAGAHPDILTPGTFPRGGSFGALGENLKRDMRAIIHDSEHLPNKGVGNLIVEQVRHGIDETAGSWFEAIRFAQAFGVQANIDRGVRGSPWQFGPASFEG